VGLPVPGTAAGLAGLAALLAEPGRALLALDYDGTLAPVVPRPQDAVPQPGALDALHLLAGRVGSLVLLTGRPAAAVVELGGLHDVPGLTVLGQYGAERWSAGRTKRAAALPGVAVARTELPGLVAMEGAVVEDKGSALVVHTRRCSDPAGALLRLRAPVAALADRTGLALHGGRLVLELRPPGHDKGAALLAAAHGCTSVAFAGDDVGDLPAYDAVDRLRTAGVPGLLVCSDSEEVPEALRDRADLVVAGPLGVVALLQDLSAALTAPPPPIKAKGP